MSTERITLDLDAFANAIKAVGIQPPDDIKCPSGSRAWNESSYVL